jgi:hypothetical protein
MAAYPCSIGNHRYAGPQRSAYITTLDGSKPITCKQRLCRAHLEDLEQTCMNLLNDVSDDGQMSMLCEFRDCGKARETTLFVKVYAENGDEPTEYAADFCRQHATAVGLQLQIASSIAM